MDSKGKLDADGELDAKEILDTGGEVGAKGKLDTDGELETKGKLDAGGEVGAKGKLLALLLVLELKGQLVVELAANGILDESLNDVFVKGDVHRIGVDVDVNIVDSNEVVGFDVEIVVVWSTYSPKTFLKNELTDAYFLSMTSEDAISCLIISLIMRLVLVTSDTTSILETKGIVGYSGVIFSISFHSEEDLIL